MINAGIIGGAGYTAGELIPILMNHPEVNLQFVHSTSNAGNPVCSIHQHLEGETTLFFSDSIDLNVDVLFLCQGHGKSIIFLQENIIPATTKIIDLSRDFRLLQENEYNGRKFVYGLPELNKPAITKSDNIANPGCFATCIQLAVLPLAAENLLKSDVHVTAITGSTGAGQSLSETVHFSWRNNNISVYKAFNHQHLDEIIQSTRQLQPDFSREINFIPMRGDFTRGIFASIYTDIDNSEESLSELYKSFYENHPFTILSDNPINLKQVVNTNKCLLHVEKHGNKAHITSIIDNLTKGASGQAVQNMNLIFGLEESAGLHLKPSNF